MKNLYMKRLLLFCSAACLLEVFSCTQKVTSNEESRKIDSLISQTNALLEKQEYDLVYSDTLPCKDCKGIKTTLQLSTRSNKFLLREEFLGTQIAPNVLLGNFNTERGYEKDGDATLYVLNDELPETEHLYFLRETGKDHILVKLDNERKKTNHSNFILTQIP